MKLFSMFLVLFLSFTGLPLEAKQHDISDKELRLFFTKFETIDKNTAPLKRAKKLLELGKRIMKEDIPQSMKSFNIQILQRKLIQTLQDAFYILAQTKDAHGNSYAQLLDYELVHNDLFKHDPINKILIERLTKDIKITDSEPITSTSELIVEFEKLTTLIHTAIEQLSSESTLQKPSLTKRIGKPVVVVSATIIGTLLSAKFLLLDPLQKSLDRVIEQNTEPNNKNNQIVEDLKNLIANNGELKKDFKELNDQLLTFITTNLAIKVVLNNDEAIDLFEELKEKYPYLEEQVVEKLKKEFGREFEKMNEENSEDLEL